MKVIKSFSRATSLGFGLFLCAASSAVYAQVPTVTDLVDNNCAFLKLDRTNNNLGANFGMHYIDTVTVNGVIKAYYIKNVNSVLSVGLAESTNGINFTDRGAVLLKGASGAYDEYMASFPGVWYENGTYYLVYEAVGEGNHGNIALATSTNGLNFTKQGVILQPEADWEFKNLGTPSLYK